MRRPCGVGRRRGASSSRCCLAGPGHPAARRQRVVRDAPRRRLRDRADHAARCVVTALLARAWAAGGSSRPPGCSACTSSSRRCPTWTSGCRSRRAASRERARDVRGSPSGTRGRSGTSGRWRPPDRPGVEGGISMDLTPYIGWIIFIHVLAAFCSPRAMVSRSSSRSRCAGRRTGRGWRRCWTLELGARRRLRRPDRPVPRRDPCRDRAPVVRPGVDLGLAWRAHRHRHRDDAARDRLLQQHPDGDRPAHPGAQGRRPDPVPVSDAELAAVLASRRPEQLLAIGGGGFVVILYLMMFKPF